MGTSTSFDGRDIARYLGMEMREFRWLCEDVGLKGRKKFSAEEVQRIMLKKRSRPNGGTWSPKRRGVRV